MEVDRNVAAALPEVPSTVLHPIHASARRRPSAPALMWLSREADRAGTHWTVQCWSFASMWTHAITAAGKLRALTAGRFERRDATAAGEPCRVGVAIDEGPALALVELAVLAAGCSIVPLDAKDVAARLAGVIADADIELVVAKDAVSALVFEKAAAVASQSGQSRPRIVEVAEVLDLSAEDTTSADPAIGAQSATLDPSLDSSCTSHVFFTSGSTGRPKGCVVAHSSLANYCCARNAIHAVGEDAVCLVASAHTFDPSLGDIMATWAAGGCIALAPRAELFANLGSLLATSRATHLCCTPSLFATLSGTSQEDPQALPQLRVVALGGEPTPPGVLKAWAGRPDLRLLNTYGVTECCVYNAVRKMSPDDVAGLIGSPLPGNSLAIVGGHDEDAAETQRSISRISAGETGELLIAGVQVGKGYARRPDLTQQRFVQDPHLGRAYLTGDLACEGPDGIMLLGRKDNQVKIRGHRIELAEVEYWLLAAAGPLLISAAAACVKGKLVAFCVACPGFSAPKAEKVLRAALRWMCEMDVPASMRPQRYVFVTALPLTTSGKVARGQLPDLLQENSETSELANDSDDEMTGNKRSPPTPLEELVAEVWATELALAPKALSRGSNFHDLGGHSIAALRACRRLALKLDNKKPNQAADTSSQPGEADEALGGDLGELSGTFAPAELLCRPVLREYVAFLTEQGLGLSVESAISEESVATCQLSTHASARDDDSKETACDVDVAAEDCVNTTACRVERGHGGPVDFLYQAASAGAIPLIDFLVTRGHAPVDGLCSMKRLKSATRAQRSLGHVGKDGPRPPAPLHSAAAAGSQEAVLALLGLRASVTATEAHGVMAIHLAAERGPASIVTSLLEARAPIAAKDLNLQTTLHFASRSGNVETLSVLLQAWLADSNLVSQSSRVYGGPLDWRDRWHRTPVHWATLNDHGDVLRLLLQSKAAAEPPKVSGFKHAKNTTLRHESPLEIARRRGQDSVAELLVAYGAVEEDHIKPS
eukprot:TRINITY_DN62969_c0_g1_i1.p1 TRINITY_DN62969_c0_g1~~TRINITY_DN62969_c0_g1_i1.p1  ORF type:complete len:1010 (+),score=109.94 TRINITY_DN62969_c0_g1_i1:31-3030(+)